MKKLKALLFVAIMCFATNASAASKWDATRNTYDVTTSGISVDFNEDESKVIYTIPEDFNGKNIYFNIVEDVQTILEETYTPGESAAFTIEIVNKSSFNYNYLKDSLKVDSLDLDVDFDVEYRDYKDEVWYLYDYANNRHLGKYVKGSYAFDGSLIRASYSINRTGNDGLFKLFLNSENIKVENNKNVYYYNTQKCTISSTLCSWMLTDEVLGAELIAQGYENGIDDLNTYYLNHYNSVFNTNATKLEDLDLLAIYGYRDSTKNYNGGILNGNRYNMRETNAEVSALGYNWFYNECLLLSPNADAEGNAIGYKETTSGNYSIGNYMRNENTVLENVFRKDLEIVSKNGSNLVTPFELYVDGLYTTNAFMSMNLGFMMSFELQKEVVLGTLIVNHVDVDGNKLTDTKTSEAEVGETYTTSELTFENYFLVEVQGEATGKYINGTIEVTYVYDKDGSGDVGDDPIEPPHTDVEVEVEATSVKTNTNESNILVFDDKKKYIKK